MTTSVDIVPDLGQLQTFLAVMEQHGFSAAARRLGISQPSVSQQMRRLEDRIGHKLFVRDGGGVALTSDGEALVIFARAMFGVADKVRDYFGQPEIEGTLRVGFNEDFARTALPSLLAIFARSYPAVELVGDCNFSSRQLFADLDDGKLDLVVAKLPAARPRGEVLWREPLRWVGRNRDMRFDDGPIPLVAASTANSASDLVLEALAAAGRSWRVRFRSPSLGALEAAICSGLGIAAMMRGMSLGRVQLLDGSSGLPPLPDVALCLDVDPAAGPTVTAFAAVLREAVLQMNPAREGVSEVHPDGNADEPTAPDLRSRELDP